MPSNTRRRIASSLAMVLSAGLALAQPAEQPADQMTPPPPPQGEARDRPGPPPDRFPETFDRDTVKKRLESRLKELTSLQERLQKAMEKLDSGAPLTDVWAELGPPPGGGRFNAGGGPAPGNYGERLKERMGDRAKGRDGKPPERDGPGRDGGPREHQRRSEVSDRIDNAAAMLNLPQGGGEPLNPEEREKLFRYLDDNIPRAAERFRNWQKLDPDGFEVFLSRMAPRVREAGAVLRRDPDGAKLRMKEVETGLDVLDATQSLRELYLAPAPDQDKLAEARESLKQALGAQLDARFAVHQHQISTLERQIQELRKQTEEMSAKKAEKIAERAAAFEASVRERAASAKPESPEKADRPK